jgi:ferredoxin--NADP+ reductase
MHRILEKKRLSEDACILKVHAPHVSAAQPGQFVMVQHTELSELIPLSILDTFEEGFTCLVKAVGRSSLEILEEAESFQYVAGPLGKPFPVKQYGKIVFYAHSWGIAPILNVARALKAAGNRLLLQVVSEDFYLRERAEELFEEVRHSEDIIVFDADLVVSAGENGLSYRLTEIYRNTPIVSMVSVHMLDAVGLCLVCRVMVDGKQLLACTEGPWFEAHKVNWKNLIDRESLYKEQESLALEEYRKILRRKSLRSE